jgi:hypothetical protein
MDYGKVMMPDIIGIELQKTPYPVMALLQFQLAAWNRKIECTLELSPLHSIGLMTVANLGIE